MTTDTYESTAEAHTDDLMAGKRISLSELATELSAIDLRLRQLARAAETPAAPVELEATIDSLRSTAKGVREAGERMQFLARVVDGDVPLAKAFRDTGDPWGVAARDTDRQAYGGPAIIPTQWQLIKLARDAERAAERGVETTTFPDAMQGIGIGWESKAASARRRRERDAAVAVEVLRTQCKTCEAGDGEQCRTKKGWVAEQPHVGRQREAEATVDARLGYLDINPVAVPDA
ncbi:zinc finger domain-containing protein [Streptomyces sp. MN6]